MGGWGKGKKVRDEAYGGEARGCFVDHVSNNMSK